MSSGHFDGSNPVASTFLCPKIRLKAAKSSGFHYVNCCVLFMLVTNSVTNLSIFRIDKIADSGLTQH